MLIRIKLVHYILMESFLSKAGLQMKHANCLVTKRRLENERVEFFVVDQINNHGPGTDMHSPPLLSADLVASAQIRSR